jgi:hypothetical protein
MRKLLIIATGLWPFLMSVPAVDFLGGYHEQKLAGMLSAFAVVVTAVAAFFVARLGAVARLKDKVLVAQLRQRCDALRAGARPHTDHESAWERLLAAPSCTASVVGLVVNAGVIALGFLLIGVDHGLQNESFVLTLVVGSVPTLTFATLWRTDQIARLQRELKKAELTATLMSLDPSAVPAAVVAASVRGGGGTVSMSVPSAPLVAGAFSETSGQVIDGAAGQDSTRADTRWRIRTLLLMFLVLVGVVAKVGPGKGAYVFSWGVGGIGGIALTSLPFAALLLLIARRVWRREWSYRGAYATTLAGALVSWALVFVADGLFTVSFYYPYEFRIGWIASSCLVPPLVWSRAQTANGEHVGMKRACVGALLIAPVGFAFAFAIARWVWA